MSLQATTWALYDATRDLDANEFRLLMVMADMADQNGRNIYPSAATLADLCGVTTRTIRTKLASLETKGLIIRDDQSILAHIPANRRPIAWRLNMDGNAPTTAPATVAEATQPSGENIAPQTTDPTGAASGVKTASGVKSGVKPDRKSGVKHAFTQTHSKGRTVEPGEAARTREAEPKPQPAAGTEAALAVWQPNAEARALADGAHADLVAEAEKFRCKQLADGHIAKNLDAAFTLWLRRGIEGGYLTPATRERPSDTRHKPTPPTTHRHTWDCAHVKAIMKPHEAEYSHERHGWGASDWMTACQTEADRLNQTEGTSAAALADGGDA
ncbi:helix-turn-helix domain-containing protein [Bifidobacterium criceti]|uniref:Cryptic prophage protein n=1 Tax=Bifidobacterium criceti TaxID=1960969 RepID=A0A2A2EDB1_9BIFI|nr:helix-turn-helix domain-containing protein [Bifidobacterium criceti]PAU67199.1 cryptic prophage protein [Bifidobacterium criceti]